VSGHAKPGIRTAERATRNPLIRPTGIMFFFKKTVAVFLSPVGVCVGLLLLGLVLLWFTRRQKLGKALVTTGTLVLMLFGCRLFSGMLLRSLEYKFLPAAVEVETESEASTPDAKWIAVMGASWCPDPRLPPNSQVDEALLTRLVEAARLHRAMPNSNVIVAVAGTSTDEEKAAFVARLAADVGLDLNNAVVIGNGRDSKDEARLVGEVIGGDRVVLVTSAYHMPRCVALFQGQGMNPIPSPAGHVTRALKRVRLRDVVPSSKGLARAELAVYEYLGLLWASLRGQTQPDHASPVATTSPIQRKRKAVAAGL